MNEQLKAKYAKLTELLGQLGSAVVCLSGGVDSTLLAKLAYDVLGDQCIAVTFALHSLPQGDVEEATHVAQEIGLQHELLPMDELAVEGFVSNPPDRCYYCKQAILTQVWEFARKRGITQVIEGSNADDAHDWRPGRRALQEQGVISPLADAGFTKAEVRELAHELGLSVWARPSAPCLATRFAPGMRITAERLRAVDAAEAYLYELGFSQVRVRVHGNLSRIEVAPHEVARLSSQELAPQVATRLHELGFAFVSVDLEGYRLGSLQAGLTT